MVKAGKWLGQLAILGGVYWAGLLLSEKSGLPIPGSVLGVLLLFFLLLFGVLKLEYVEEVADFLLKHLMFFFVPIAVGLMASMDIFYESGWILALALFAAALIPFWSVGLFTQYLIRRRGECKI
jgi:holin-like protein